MAALLLLLAARLSAEPAAPAGPPAGALPASTAPGVEVLPPAPKPAPAYLLRHKLAAGSQARYRITLDGKGTLGAAQGKVVLPVTLGVGLLLDQTVDGVYPDGSGTVVTRFTVTSLRVNGVDRAQAYQPMVSAATIGGLAPLRTVLTPTGLTRISEAGKAQDIQFHPSLDPSALARIAQGISFPEQAVKAGESWGTPPGPDAYCRTTLVSVSTGKGHPIARLKQASAWAIQGEAGTPGHLPGRGPQMAVSGRQAADLDVRFDLDGGYLLSATGSVDVSLTISPGTPESRHLLLKLGLRIERGERPAEAPAGRAATEPPHTR